ncbi:MAG: PspA-associated protein PspAB, partial [Solirubrobacteraceae bacterium]
DFTAIVKDMEQVVRATAADSAIAVDTHEDSYGFSWLILRLGDPGGAPPDGDGAEAGSGQDFDGLVVCIHGVAQALEAGGYGERLLCAVFAFQDERGRPLYWIYNFKRGSFYPFVPSRSAHQRDNERELVLRAQAGGELPVEPELERWFALWGIPL